MKQGRRVSSGRDDRVARVAFTWCCEPVSQLDPGYRQGTTDCCSCLGSTHGRFCTPPGTSLGLPLRRSLWKLSTLYALGWIFIELARDSQCRAYSGQTWGGVPHSNSRTRGGRSDGGNRTARAVIPFQLTRRAIRSLSDTMSRLKRGHQACRVEPFPEELTPFGRKSYGATSASSFGSSIAASRAAWNGGATGMSRPR
jgi:hypothetical protein